MELILYATPRGPLGRACDRYFELVEALGATAAQAYPPHCTITGFFRRAPDRVPAVAAEVDEVLAATLGGRSPDVEVVGLRRLDRWIGLELLSADLAAVGRGFAERHDQRDGEDDIRLKDWLHLSLAYRVPHTGPHAALADELVDPGADADWVVGLWQRDTHGRWTALTAGPVLPGGPSVGAPSD